MKGPGIRIITLSMGLRRLGLILSLVAVISLLCYPSPVTAGDIVHDDDVAPKKPGCENDFVLVTDLDPFSRLSS